MHYVLKSTKDDKWYTGCTEDLRKRFSEHNDGKVVLVESRQVTDPETNQKFTIKRYWSEKEALADDQWRHKKITLSPDNKAFKDIVLKNVSGDDFRVVAEFIEVL